MAGSAITEMDVDPKAPNVPLAGEALSQGPPATVAAVTVKSIPRVWVQITGKRPSAGVRHRDRMRGSCRPCDERECQGTWLGGKARRAWRGDGEIHRDGFRRWLRYRGVNCHRAGVRSRGKLGWVRGDLNAGGREAAGGRDLQPSAGIGHRRERDSWYGTKNIDTLA